MLGCGHLMLVTNVLLRSTKPGLVVSQNLFNSAKSVRMKFSTFSALFAIASQLGNVNALGDLGLCLGVKRNSDGQCKETSDYESDFDILKAYTTTVRVYAASDCNTLQNIYPALESKGFSLFLGVWPTDDAHFQAEQTALTTYLPQISIDTIRGITVGSEALYRKDLTADELADKINTIKQLLSGIKDKNGNSYSALPVGTADSWNLFVAGYNAPAIEACDFVFANAFSYWQGQTMANASYSYSDDIMQAMEHIQSVKGSDIDIWVGETGWPTEGENFGDSVPSAQNAQQFWKEGICALRAWGVNTFVFEAFDETWKPSTSDTSGVENHWGILDSNGTPKYDLSCDF